MCWEGGLGRGTAVCGAEIGRWNGVVGGGFMCGRSPSPSLTFQQVSASGMIPGTIRDTFSHCRALAQTASSCGISSVIPQETSPLTTNCGGDGWDPFPGDVCPPSASHRSQNLHRVTVKTVVFTPSRARPKELLLLLLLLFPTQEVSNVAELRKKA